ncbi:hypothetical protein J2857_001862 [Neorhizobium galegae]|uniref:hypothetical protein n=1 Tax=Neorhizobium galegae TaxID=399 RepID=UPI001AE0FA70|nr:hypothetical protein [Neorhizobium galegae]MBP2559111.1 hypothetical protein [Neorhizobium galegae]
MAEVVNKLRDVYGVGRDMPLNYVSRKDVDDDFISNLTRDKHIVVFGSSKQGKTTLRKHCLSEGDYIVVSCLNTMSIDDLNGAILKASGYQIEQTQTKTVGGHLKYGVEFKGEGKVPLLASASASGTLENEKTEENSIEIKRLEIDLHDVNDIVISLKEINFNKFIVLEDFHYLPVQTQQDFSFALKAYHENSKLCFIVVGVWRDKNRLIYYNGDLTNRVASVDADTWRPESLAEVVKAGEYLLNIQFDPATVAGIISHSAESVSLLQEACFRICENENVFETQVNQKTVGKGVDVPQLMRDIVNNQSGRYSAFITNFAEGFQQTEYDMYRWIIYVVLSVTIEELEVGIRRNVFSKLIKERHSSGEKLNEGNITQALQSSASLQVTKNVRPIIIDYDQTTRVLNVVDKSFLIWLSMQDRNELIKELGIS